MGKFYGMIGFNTGTTETSPGVWTENIVERAYYGDVIKYTKRTQEGEGLNDNITINNRLSIVADPYAYENFCTIRYVNWLNTHWKITNVEIQFPRLILTIGGLYNGQ